MAVSLTSQNKQTLKRLLKTGRWNNASEVLRYGLHLAAEEVESKEKRSWPEPISEEEMTRIYKEESAEERRSARAAAKASVKASHQAVRRLAKEGF